MNAALELGVVADTDAGALCQLFLFEFSGRPSIA
jgi:hypothetical protein